MKDKPILFSGPMVRAILEGRKTMTRRVVKFPEWFLDEYTRFGRHEIQSEIDCPYQVRDRLWVRETWAKCTHSDDCSGLYFRADGEHNDGAQRTKWKPSIFMPRWASRITLRVTGVKVERVKEITEEDAIREGIMWRSEKLSLGIATRCGIKEWSFDLCELTPQKAFMYLWDSINEKRGFGWAKNPYCWCYTFEVVK
jgi:hypothetical protein